MNRHLEFVERWSPSVRGWRLLGAKTEPPILARCPLFWVVQSTGKALRFALQLGGGRILVRARLDQTGLDWGIVKVKETTAIPDRRPSRFLSLAVRCSAARGVDAEWLS